MMSAGRGVDLDALLSLVLECIDHFKYLLARSKYVDLVNLLEEYSESSDSEVRKYSHQMRAKLSANELVIQNMLNRCDEIDTAFRMASSSMDNWIFGSETSGISTYYKIDDDGLISLRVEGTLYDLPLYEQLCAIYEIGLYSKWVPFCSTSTLLRQISHVELLASLLMTTPFGISREVVVHAFGANCLQENQSIVIVTHSIENYEGVDIPLISNSLFNDRCEVKYMYAVTTLLSPTTAKFSCLLKLDVKFRVHQRIMTWFIKQLAGVVLPLLRSQAKYIADHPEDLLYSERFAENPEFYIHFLLPEFRAFIQSQNWTQPTIGCLGYAGIPVKGADYSHHLYSFSNPSTTTDLSQVQVLCLNREIKRDISLESRSSVLSYFSCVQGDSEDISNLSSFVDQNQFLLRDLEDPKKSVPTPSSKSKNECCCCFRYLFCC